MFAGSAALAGEISFVKAEDFTSGGTQPTALVRCDLNGDSFDDFAVVNQAAAVGSDRGTVAVFLGGQDGLTQIVPAVTVGREPHAATVGDFDGDSRTDLAVANYVDDTITILLGNNNGTFDLAGNVALADETGPTALGAGHFDGDDTIDLAVANLLNNSVAILLGAGDGTFATSDSVAFGEGTQPNSVTVDDFDGDDTSDVAVANFGTDEVAVLLGNGDGTLSSPSTVSVGDAPNSITAANVVGSNATDLVVANGGSDSDNVSVLEGNGAGGFSLGMTVDAGLGPTSVEAADVDGDALLDLLVANSFSQAVSYLKNTGTAFAPVSLLGTLAVPSSVAAGQFRGDGNLDLVVANEGADSVSVMLGTGSGEFAAQQAFETGAAPSSIACADFDGDGIPDLAVADGYSDDITIFLGDGTGGMAAASVVLLPVESAPNFIVAAKLNGDQHVDLAVANFGLILEDDPSPPSLDTVTILLGNGDGTFDVPPLNEFIVVGDGPAAIALGSFNPSSDGVLDLAVANYYDDDIHVLFGDGAGGFGSPTTLSLPDPGWGAGPRHVAAADFNGDSRDDIAVATDSSDTVAIFPSNGDGTFALQVSYDLGRRPDAIGMGDFDKDGNIDLAVANFGLKPDEDPSPPSLDTVTILLGGGDGTFASGPELTAGDGPSEIAVADINRDGAVDLAVVNENSHDVSVFGGDGTGSFSLVQTLNVGNTPVSVIAAELSADRAADLAVANWNSDTVTVLLNSSSITELAPVADAGSDVTVDEGEEGIVLDGSGSFDSNGDPITYEWMQTDGAYVPLANATTVSPSFDAPMVSTDETLVFQLVVNDGETDSNPDTVSIHVLDASEYRPEADAGSDQTVNEDVAVALSGSGTDPRDLALTYHWEQVVGPPVTLSNKDVASPTFTSPGVTQETVLEFELRVDNGELTSKPDRVSVTVLDSVTEPPQADAGADAGVGEASLVYLNGSGTSQSGGPLTFSWVQTVGPAVTLSSTTAANPSFAAPRVTEDTVLTFELRVSDGIDVSAPDSVTITVQDTINEAPAADAGSNQTAAEGDTVTLNGSASSDPNGDSLSFTWTQLSGPTVILHDAGTAAPWFEAPDATDQEVLPFRLVVNDGKDSSVPDVVRVTVVPDTPDRPIADASEDQIVDEQALVTLDGSASSDPQGGGLYYVWQQTGGTAVTISDPNAESPNLRTPQVLEDTDLEFELVVGNGTMSSVPDTVRISVLNSVNERPVADAGNEKTTSPGETVILDGTGSSDPNGDGLEFSWTQTSGMEVTISGGSSATASFVAPEVTEDAILSFQLVANDGTDDSVPDEVNVLVAAASETRPTANAGIDVSVPEQSLVTLDGRGSSGPQGSALDYEWLQTEGVEVTLQDADSSTPTFMSPAVCEENQLRFQLVVSNGTEDSTPDWVTVTVLNSINDAPEADAGADQVVELLSPVFLDGLGSVDPDTGPSPLSFRWEQTAGTQVALTGTTTPEPSFTAPANATVLVFDLEVRDGIDQDTDTVTVHVVEDSTPQIDSLEPAIGLRIGGTPFTITGQNFSANTRVEFDSWLPTSYAVESLAGINGFTPPGDPGSVTVTVADVLGGVSDSLAGGFRFTADPFDAELSMMAGIPVQGTVLSDPADPGTKVAVTFVEIPEAGGYSGTLGFDTNIDFPADAVPIGRTGRAIVRCGPNIDSLYPDNPPTQPAESIPIGTAADIQLWLDSGTAATAFSAPVTLEFSLEPSPIAEDYAAKLCFVETSFNAELWPQLSSSQLVPVADLSIEPGDTRVEIDVELPGLYVPMLVGTERAAELSIGTGQGEQEETVAVPVDLVTNGFEPVWLEFTVEFDAESLELTGVSAGAAAEAAGKTVRIVASGEGTFTVEIGGGTAVLGSGEVAEISFTIAADAVQGVSIPLRCTVANGRDAQSEPIQIEREDGAVMVRYGGYDVNSDGRVDAVDVQRAINQALGFPPLPGDPMADFNGDGRVNAIDIQLIINAALGIFPVI